RSRNGSFLHRKRSARSRPLLLGPRGAQEWTRQSGEARTEIGRALQVFDQRIEVARLLREGESALGLAVSRAARRARSEPLAGLERGQPSSPLGETRLLQAQLLGSGERGIAKLMAAGETRAQARRACLDFGDRAIEHRTQIDHVLHRPRAQ